MPGPCWSHPVAACRNWLLAPRATTQACAHLLWDDAQTTSQLLPVMCGAMRLNRAFSCCAQLPAPRCGAQLAPIQLLCGSAGAAARQATHCSTAHCNTPTMHHGGLCFLLPFVASAGGARHTTYSTPIPWHILQRSLIAGGACYLSRTLNRPSTSLNPGHTRAPGSCHHTQTQQAGAVHTAAGAVRTAGVQHPNSP
jgi:hypothetical protein